MSWLYILIAVLIVVGVVFGSLQPVISGHQGQKVFIPAEINVPSLVALALAFVLLVVGVIGLFILFLVAALLCSFA